MWGVRVCVRCVRKCVFLCICVCLCLCVGFGAVDKHSWTHSIFYIFHELRYHRLACRHPLLHHRHRHRQPQYRRPRQQLRPPDRCQRRQQHWQCRHPADAVRVPFSDAPFAPLSNCKYRTSFCSLSLLLFFFWRVHFVFKYYFWFLNRNIYSFFLKKSCRLDTVER